MGRGWKRRTARPGLALFENFRYAQTTGLSSAGQRDSSLKSVNEKIFPLYYPSLLGKMPGENQMKLPMILPNTWEEVKQEIVIPFLAESVKTESPESILPLPERIRTWRQSR